MLLYAGHLLDDGAALASCGLSAGSTVHQTSRLRGGKPVKVSKAVCMVCNLCNPDCSASRHPHSYPPMLRRPRTCQPNISRPTKAPASPPHQTTCLAAPRCAPQVKILTNHLPCGQEVTVDLEPGATKAEVSSHSCTACTAEHALSTVPSTVRHAVEPGWPKQFTGTPATLSHLMGEMQIRAKLEAVTGVPAEHQKVMLSGINQIVMGDKRWVAGS